MSIIKIKKEEVSPIILLMMMFFGMRYMDPPNEYGIAINFGTSDFGNGPPEMNETPKSTTNPAQPEQELKKNSRDTDRRD